MKEKHIKIVRAISYYQNVSQKKFLRSRKWLAFSMEKLFVPRDLFLE